MEWADVHEGEPLHVEMTTEELLVILERNLQRIEQNRGRVSFGKFDRVLEEEMWISRRRVNITRLRHSGELTHYMALYPSPVEG
jgi:hypothetical protein